MQSFDFELSIDGKAWGAQLKRRTSLSLIDKRGFEADELTITLADHDGKIIMPTKGATIDVTFVADGGRVYKGAYVAQRPAFSGPPDVVTITAYSADFRASLLEQRSESYDDNTLKALIDTIAARHQLGSAVAQSIAATALPHLDQDNESDANLLTRITRDIDAQFSVKAGKLLVIPIASGQTASGQDLPSLNVSRTNLARYAFSEEESDVSGVIAKWHNRGEAKTEEVLAGDESGSVRTLKEQYRDEATAQQAAEAALARFRRGLAKFDADLKGFYPALIPETPIVAKGFKPKFDVLPWIATEVTHAIDGGGAVTRYAAEASTAPS